MSSIKDQHFDVAIVFWSGETEISCETLRRINYALKLYHKGLIKNIICVGGARPSKNFYGAEIMRQIFLASGIPENRLWSEQISNDTQSNWCEASKIIKQQKFKSVTLISSPLHLFRLKHILSQQNDLNFSLNPYPYSDSEPRINLLELWLDIHYEWTAFILLKILPHSVYRKIINILRSQISKDKYNVC